MDDLRTLIASLPKAELHIHLEGSIDAALAQQLAAVHGIELPVDPETGAWRPLSDFREFVGAYLAVSACLQRADDLVLVIDNYARSCARQNIVYAEVTFTPMTHLRRGVAREALIEGLEAGRIAARERYGVELRWVFDIVRTFPDQAEPTLAFALDVAARDPQAVAGLGLGGPERPDEDLTAFMEVFARAKVHGLRSLPHAGECAGARNVYAALTLLDADRLGHGIGCLEDPELVAILRDREIPLEVCPSSNVALAGIASFPEHPLPRLLAADLQVCLGSDDPGFFGFDLVGEYVRCAETWAWSEEDILRLVRNSMRHAPRAWWPDSLEETGGTSDSAPEET